MDKEKLNAKRHSLSHIMAMAVLKKFPDAQLGIGPTIETGFYYDFLLPEKLSDADLPKIEKEMKHIIAQNIKFEKSISSRDEALKKMSGKQFKTELINDLPVDEEISFYTSGNFSDLCSGPHITETKEIKIDSFKLTHTAGAYWRGSEKNQMLTRIYGAAFDSKEELENYLQMLKEAKERDHRKLGKELDLFTFSDLVGAGLPLWTPKGTILRNELDAFVWELRKKYGYSQVTIPHITKKDLYVTSGHWEKFGNELFKINTREGHEFVMKPMNCPHHTQIYAHTHRSYRDLPQRYAETTMVYRDEQSGELSGLSRVRCISQDDAHVFCSQDQMEEEILKIIDIINIFYPAFGLKLETRLSLHDPENFSAYLGTPEVWQSMEDKLRKVLKSKKIEFSEAKGEAAFYGPKIDFMSKDSMGRQWQVATVQLDFNMPVRFKLNFTNKEGKEETVVMLHAAIMGSIERFVSMMIEHLAGNFPLWLCPTQVKIITVGEVHIDFAKKLAEEFESHNIRTEIDDSNETVGNKIRRASKEKSPYTLVIGDKEMNSKELAVRVRLKENILNINKEEFITKIKTDIKNRNLELL